MKTTLFALRCIKNCTLENHVGRFLSENSNPSKYHRKGNFDFSILTTRETPAEYPVIHFCSREDAEHYISYYEISNSFEVVPFEVNWDYN